MKRCIAILTAGVLALSLAGCSLVERPAATAGAGASPVIDRILARSELRVATSAHQPPLTARAEDGSLIGFDIDLANAIARAMNVRLSLVELPFEEVLPAVARGEVDMALSGLTMTPQRNLKVAFVGPYLVSGMSILTRSRTMSRLRRAEELDRPEVKIAILRSSTAEKFAQENTPKAQIVQVAELDDGVQMVRDGSVDVLMADHPFCMVAVYRYSDLVTLETPFTFEPLGVALPPNDPLLVNWMQNTLADLDDSGAVYEMMYRWFEEDDWMERLTE